MVARARPGHRLGHWDRDASGFVSRWGTLEGLQNVESPRKFEVLPYVVTRHHDPAAEGEDDEWDHTQNFGIDLKYGPTATLTLNATIQPDFGQVEADPAVLNLSPFETFYEEKRPFFIEGARFFQHPHFNMFYSRRIGTGDLNSRIRGAAKLTGKVGGKTSIAALFAATDLAGHGQAHNPFKVGEEQAYYGLLRFGREFADGNHRFNLMGTTVRRDKGSFADATPALPARRHDRRLRLRDELRRPDVPRTGIGGRHHRRPVRQRLRPGCRRRHEVRHRGLSRVHEIERRLARSRRRVVGVGRTRPERHGIPVRAR